MRPEPLMQPVLAAMGPIDVPGLATRTDGLTRYSELAREKMWARIHLIPALQAEEDRDQVRRYLADKAREKELLGTETKVYNSDRQVPYRTTHPLF